MMNAILSLEEKAIKLYEKVPQQYQQHKEELKMVLSNMINEYRILQDYHSVLKLDLDDINKNYNKLKLEYSNLSKEYDKLNKKLNNELIR